MNASWKAKEESACGIIWDCRQNEGNVFVRNEENRVNWSERSVHQGLSRNLNTLKHWPAATITIPSSRRRQIRSPSD